MIVAIAAISRTAVKLKLYSFLMPDIEDDLIEDSTAPVITLNGAARIDHNFGDVYTDLGATATDNVDDNITVNTLNSVNVNTIKTYIG